jgi:hypothetical protein
MQFSSTGQNKTGFTRVCPAHARLGFVRARTTAYMTCNYSTFSSHTNLYPQLPMRGASTFEMQSCARHNSNAVAHTVPYENKSNLYTSDSLFAHVCVDKYYVCGTESN